MAEANFSVDFQARLVSTPTALAAGDVLVRSLSASTYALATTAARAGRSSSGILLQAGDPNSRAVVLQATGYVPAAVTGLGSGDRLPVRVSSVGRLERVDYSSFGTDDIVGIADTDGGCQVWFGGVGGLDAYGPISTYVARLETDDDTETDALRIEIPGGAADVLVTVMGVSPVGDMYRAELRGAYSRNIGGTLQVKDAAAETSPVQTGDATNWESAMGLDDGDALVTVTGAATVDVAWVIVAQRTMGAKP